MNIYVIPDNKNRNILAWVRTDPGTILRTEDPSYDDRTWKCSCGTMFKINEKIKAYLCTLEEVNEGQDDLGTLLTEYPETRGTKHVEGRKLAVGRKMGLHFYEKFGSSNGPRATAERGQATGRERGRERTLLSILSSRVIRQTRVPRSRGVASKLTAIYPREYNGVDQRIVHCTDNADTLSLRLTSSSRFQKPTFTSDSSFEIISTTVYVHSARANHRLELERWER